MLSVFLMVVFMVVTIVLTIKGIGGLDGFMTIVGLALAFCLLFGAMFYLDTNSIDIEREEIVLAMNEFASGDLTDSPILEEIVDFNTNLVELKRQRKNIWVNFGISKKVLDVQPIRHEEYDNE